MKITGPPKCLVYSGICLLMLSSCISRKEMIYFQESDNVNFDQAENLKIKPGDLLTIRVSAPEQEAAQPFNLTKSIASVERIGGQVELETYMVSDLGNIEFPVIGTIKVKGLTNFELSERIKNDVSNYVQDPIVNVRILNFQISVLGEVKNPGTFNIEDDHLSLAKALGMAGDLTINGRRDNILIMREIDGRKTNAYLDITDSRVVKSPYYNIKQNDVIYIEPRAARRQAAGGLGVVSSYLSIASVLISFVILITR